MSVGQISPNDGEHLAVVPNTMRFAVLSEYAFANEASFLDHSTRRGVRDDPKRDQSDCAIAGRVGDHERRTFPLRPGLAGIAERRSVTARDRVVVQPPLRFRIVTRCIDRQLVLRLAEAQHDVTVGQWSVGWRQLDPQR